MTTEILRWDMGHGDTGDTGDTGDRGRAAAPPERLSGHDHRDPAVGHGTRVTRVTGDVQLRPQSACLVMTTEILRWDTGQGDTGDTGDRGRVVPRSMLYTSDG
uniref:Uncharacterized protein n=1 Tax=Columba livia TaxID=8932 RepID=R7VRE9_COLLI